MTLHQLINPLFVYRNRERILPFIKERSPNFMRFRPLKRFRNRHAGDRCFIIGNGPSLTITDLERVGSEVTFAANKIYLAFDKTNWRPSYYVVEDDHMIRQHHHEIRELKSSVKFVTDDWELLFRGEEQTVIYPRNLLDLNRFPHVFRQRLSGCLLRLHGHLYQFATRVFHGIFNGLFARVDFNYAVDHKGTDTIIHAAGNPSDHFTSEYFEPGEVRYAPQLKLAERTMHCARQFYEAGGRKIWNATRGGKLEVFDRISLEEALGR